MPRHVFCSGGIARGMGAGRMNYSIDEGGGLDFYAVSNKRFC